MTSQYRCETCKHAEKRNSNEYPVKCRISKPVPMAVYKDCILWFGYVGCASHSDFPRDIEQLKKAIIEVLDTGFESSERDMVLALDRIDAWEKGELRIGEP